MNFKTSQEMFDAGYAIPTYSIMTNCRMWQYRGEIYKTFSVQTVRNTEPDFDMARIEDVRASAI